MSITVCLFGNQVEAGKGKDAQETLARLRKLVVSEADGARIDLAQADIAFLLSDFRQQQLLSEQSAARGRAVGAKLLQAQALRLEANSWERMGHPQKSIELLQQAKDLFAAAGDRRAAAACLLNVGDALLDKGDYAGAKQQFDAALPVFREIGVSEAFVPPWSASGTSSTVKGICTRRRALPAGLTLRSGKP